MSICYFKLWICYFKLWTCYFKLPIYYNKSWTCYFNCESVISSCEYVISSYESVILSSLAKTKLESNQLVSVAFPYYWSSVQRSNLRFTKFVKRCWILVRNVINICLYRHSPGTYWLYLVLNDCKVSSRFREPWTVNSEPWANLTVVSSYYSKVTKSFTVRYTKFCPINCV